MLDPRDTMIKFATPTARKTVAKVKESANHTQKIQILHGWCSRANYG